MNGPFLIIVPKTTLRNWAKELNRWCPTLNVRVCRAVCDGLYAWVS